MKTTEEKEKPKTAIAVAPMDERTIADSVMGKLAKFQERREIQFPKDYSVANALKSAYLTLLETKDSSKNPVLEKCSKESIANALLKMVIQGLSPAKAQCYFIAYGTTLTMMQSYQGKIAIAKRVAGIKDVVANVILNTALALIPECGLYQSMSRKWKTLMILKSRALIVSS